MIAYRCKKCGKTEIRPDATTLTEIGKCGACNSRELVVCNDFLPTMSMKPKEQLLAENEGWRGDEYSAPQETPDRDSVSTIPPLSAGDRISHFTIRRLIDRGGFGYVYDAFDEKLERTVALKIPHAREFSQRQKDDFLREARLSAKLSHPNVVSVHEAGEANNRIWIASDLIHGESLSKYMRRHKLNQQQIAKFAMAICSGVEAAHRLRIIHQDLKPGNLLIDRNGHLYITDFGLAFRDEPTRDANQFRMAGTLPYMAPEQLEISANVDCRTDVYAIGVIVYQMLTGERPFQGSRSEIIDQIQEGRPKLPRAFDKKISPALEAICMKAMAVDPSSRYKTASELERDLNEYLHDRVPAAYQPSLFTKSRLALTRFKWPAIASALAVALLAMILFNPFKGPSNSAGKLPVVITTEPAGADIVIVPIDPITSNPDLDRIIRPKNSLQYQVELEPGLYIVEAVGNIAGQQVIQEAYRTVPLRGGNTIEHRNRALSFQADKQGRIIWPTIKLMSTSPLELDFALIEGGPFTVGNEQIGGTPVSSFVVPDYFMQRREVLVRDYASVMNLPIEGLKQFKPEIEGIENYCATFVSFFDAAEFAEACGARIMTLEEYLFAATNKGNTNFPWGDDEIIAEDWFSNGPTPVPLDRTLGENAISGLFSQTAEWTQTGIPFVFKSDGNIPSAILEPVKCIAGDPSIIKGEKPHHTLLNSARLYQTLPINSSGDVGLGFRCCKSRMPRF